MKKFTDNVKQDTPRLVVMFKRNDQGSEEFNWGILGSIPIANLVGSIVVAQVRLATQDPYIDGCPETALVLVWKPDDRIFDLYVDSAIPVEALCGMLEMIKHTLVGTTIARQMASQQRILGPDGRPFHKVH